jgi:hypothetical protein
MIVFSFENYVTGAQSNCVFILIVSFWAHGKSFASWYLVVYNSNFKFSSRKDDLLFLIDHPSNSKFEP